MSGLKSEPKEIRICFLGESFVNGTGDAEFLGWTGRVCANVHQNCLHANLRRNLLAIYNEACVLHLKSQPNLPNSFA